MRITLMGRLRELSVFGGWGRGVVLTKAGKTLSVVGAPVAGMTRLRSYELEGEHVVHEVYGPQFRVLQARLVEVDRDVLRARLEAEFAGCGAKTALRIVATWEARGGGAGALADLLDTTPWELESDEDAAGKAIVHLASRSLSAQQRVERSLLARAPEGLARDMPAALAAWALERCGDPGKALAALRADPWAATRSIAWLSFPKLDALAEALGADPHSRSRAVAALAYIIQDMGQTNGHTGLAKDALRERLRELLGVIAADLDELVDLAAQRGYRLTRTRHAVYDAELFDVEMRCARALRAQCTPRLALWEGPAQELERCIAAQERATGARLNEGQGQVLRALMGAQGCLHTLSAVPGSGKTALMEVLAGLVPTALFAAPTGKAARALTDRLERLGRGATTVHALLESTSSGFRRDRNTPLQARLVVVDEAGMLDIHTCHALLEAVPLGTHLLLVGDPDQLESVGAGSVFQCVCNMQRADHHVLSGPSQGAGAIAEFVAGLRQGVVLTRLAGPSLEFIPPAARPDVAVDQVLGCWLDSVSARGVANVAMLTPSRKGSVERPGLNVTHLNARAQALVNPAKPGTEVPGSALRVGDRVILRRSISFAEPGTGDITRLCNGDTGSIVAVHAAGEHGSRGAHDLHLRMDDGRDVRLPAAHQRALELAYALTCHAAQGSEFAHAIVALHTASGTLHTRRLLYSACSRASQMLSVVAHEADLKGVAGRATPVRHSYLHELNLSGEAMRAGSSPAARLGDALSVASHNS